MPIHDIGNRHYAGLSTDTKPTVEDGWLFLETDTHVEFQRLAGAWTNISHLITTDITFNDNVNLIFGTGGNATLDYNGTNLVIDPRVVGSGNILVNAGSIDLNSQGSLINVGGAGNDWTVNNLKLSGSLAGGLKLITVENTDNTNTASIAVLTLRVGGSSAGDPFIDFTIPSSLQWVMGIDNSASDRFAISRGGAPGSNDALRISDATPPVITYNTTHPVGTFDYVCETCGRHDAEMFECCGKVKWHDDNEDFRAMVPL